jgi:putative membrane protein
MTHPNAWSWLTVFFVVLVWSAVDPKDRFTWFMEVLPALVALVVIVLTRRRYPLTPMIYVLILLHAIILMVGGHYTYAEVPLFDRISELFGWQRNNYDKLAHFVQGFVPAMVAREILIRQAVINGRGWMNFLIVSFCLAVSAFYEFIEWWAALVNGDAAEAFLGTQGYVWDTQSDMLLAMLGAITALLLLARRHDAQLQKLAAGRAAS